MVTLCDRTLAEGTYRATEAEADCQICLRRRNEPGRVSSAFFRSDMGSELLERSLQEMKPRRSGPREQSAAATPAPAPPTPPPPAAREQRPPIPELRSGTPLRRTFEGVYVSPEGVVVRVAGGVTTHVTFNGPVEVRRRGDRLTVRLGDVVLEFRL